MRFHPHKLPVGAAVAVLALWLVATAAFAQSPGATQRYINAMNAIARMKGLLIEKRQPSKVDLYYVNIQREVAITHFRSLIGDIELDSYEGQVLKEILSALGRVPLYDRLADDDRNLDLYGARMLAALAKIPDSRDIQLALERFESRAGTCESKAE